MTIPKEIREKFEQRQKLTQELETWCKENLDMEGMSIDYATIVDEPEGKEQTNGEYCDQYTLGEDWYRGTYYYPMDNGKYLGFDFET